MRRYALEDPRGFLSQYKDGAVIDEVQRAPELFSYLQQVLDEDERKGKFILTGSNNFPVQENISRSLAGRIAYLYLLPFSFSEDLLSGIRSVVKKAAQKYLQINSYFIPLGIIPLSIK